MRRKTRSLVGTVATLAFVLVYALGAMLVAQVGLVRDAPPLLRGLCHIVLGLAWILPMMPLVGWMLAPDE